MLRHLLACFLLSAWMVIPAQAQPATRENPQFRVTQGTSLPFGRGSAAAGMVGGKVVVVGGTSWSADRKTKSFLADTLIYDHGRWNAGPPLLEPMAEGMFASDGEALYVAGGLKAADAAVNDVQRLVHENNQWVWQKLPSLPMPIYGGAASVSRNVLYVSCGKSHGKLSNRLLSLNLNSLQEGWVARAPLPGPPRLFPAMTFCGPSLYLLGGCTMPEDGTQMTIYNGVWRYLPAKDQWRQAGALPASGYCWSAAALDSHHLLVAGRADGLIHRELWLLDVHDGSVRGIGRSIVPTTCAPLVRVSPDTWWLIGGEPDSNRTRTAIVNVFQLTK